MNSVFILRSTLNYALNLTFATGSKPSRQLTTETLEKGAKYVRGCDFFIVNFEHISYVALIFNFEHTGTCQKSMMKIFGKTIIVVNYFRTKNVNKNI